MPSTPPQPPSQPLLLQLPREIRDLIYAYLLVPSFIPITCAVTKAPKSRIAVGGEIGFCEALYQRYKLTYPLHHRSTWSVRVQDLAVPADDFQLDSSTVYMTYQLESCNLVWVGGQDFELQLLEVCRQLYAEVNEVLYSRRVFFFTSDFADSAATAFIKDRSTYVRGLIEGSKTCRVQVKGHQKATWGKL